MRTRSHDRHAVFGGASCRGLPKLKQLAARLNSLLPRVGDGLDLRAEELPLNPAVARKSGILEKLIGGIADGIECPAIDKEILLFYSKAEDAAGFARPGVSGRGS
jgi:hypothetical protein